MATDVPICGHCKRPVVGFAMANGHNLCHPPDGGSNDCFRLVVMEGHEMNCKLAACKRPPRRSSVEETEGV